MEGRSVRPFSRLLPRATQTERVLRAVAAGPRSTPRTSASAAHRVSTDCGRSGYGRNSSGSTGKCPLATQRWTGQGIENCWSNGRGYNANFESSSASSHRRQASPFSDGRFSSMLIPPARTFFPPLPTRLTHVEGQGLKEVRLSSAWKDARIRHLRGNEISSRRTSPPGSTI